MNNLTLIDVILIGLISAWAILLIYFIVSWIQLKRLAKELSKGKQRTKYITEALAMSKGEIPFDEMSDGAKQVWAEVIEKIQQDKINEQS